MKKTFGKILGAFLCLGMVLGLMPSQALQVKAAGEHKHCVCGATHKDVGDHTSESEITFEAWTKTNSLPDTAGNYYLENDVVLNVPTDAEEMYRGWQVPDGVVLCLNGHSITATGRNLSNDIFVTSNTTFTMTDCQNTGRVTHAKNADGITYTGSAINVSGGTFNMYGGSITGNDATSNNPSDGRNCGGGVYLSGTFKMYGGSITNNHSASDGGGVYIPTQWGCYFYMYGGNITGNTTEKEGGGVYAVSDITVSGNVNITGNKKADGSVSNVGLYTTSSGETKTIKIAGDMNGTLGVYTDRVVPTVENPVVIVQGAIANKDYSNIITSDSANYKIMHDSSDPTKLVLTGKDATEPTPTEHTHCIYGTSDTEACNHNNDITFVEWDKTNCLPSEAGSYYLTNDVVLPDGEASRKISKEIHLCLNGHTITESKAAGESIEVEKGAKFYVTDCIGTGAIQRTADAGKASVIRVNYDDTATVGSGIMYLYSGTITGGSGDYINDGLERSYKGGGGVYNAGTFRMFGGNIVNNTSTVNGGGICNDLTGCLELDGGTVANNTVTGKSRNGVEDGGGGIFNVGQAYMRGNAVVSDNTANGYGGGVLNKGTFQMTDSAKITGNQTKDYAYAGGGVYNCRYHYNKQIGTFSMFNNAMITDNHASQGGGLVNGYDGKVDINNDCSISNNVAHNTSGGGIYNKSELCIKGKVKINNNKAATSGGGILDDSANCTVALYLYGAEITDNVAGKKGGGVYHHYGSLVLANTNMIMDNTVQNADGTSANNLACAYMEEHNATYQYPRILKKKIAADVGPFVGKVGLQTSIIKVYAAFDGTISKDDLGYFFSDQLAYTPAIAADDAGVERIVLQTKKYPSMTEGINGTYTPKKDQELTFRSDAPLNELINVMVDNVVLDPSQYTKESGSTIIHLKADYLDTLSAGTHTIRINSYGGTAWTNFTITASSNSGNTGGSGTGSGAATGAGNTTGAGGTTGGTTVSGTGSGTGVGTTPSTPTAGITNVQPNGGTQAASNTNNQAAPKTTVNAKAPVTGEASPVSCVVLALIIVGGFALLIAELRRSRQMQKKH